MPRETYATQRARIEKEIDKLRKKAQTLITKRRKPIVASIVRSMREYDITPEEIVGAFGKGGTRRPTVAPKKGPAKSTGAAANARPKRPVPPKYKHPSTGESWTGRGKKPRWLIAAEATGAKLESFLIK
jgi:DNA-binding protein H-NS